MVARDPACMESWGQVRRFFLLGGGIVALAFISRLLIVEPSQHATDMAAIKTLLYPAARIYLSIFGNPVSGIILSLAIFGVLFFLLFRFWLELVRPLYRALQGIAAGLRAIHADTLQEAAADRVGQVVCSYTPLEGSWHEFERTLLRRQDGEHISFHSAVRPRTYFNLDSLAGRGLDLRSYMAFPGYFVGSGLVLTFMGLVAGLFFASQGMKSLNFNDARAALIALLNASTFKFATSIAGILASIILSIVVRAGIQRVEAQFEQLASTIEHHFPPLSIESVLLDQVAAMKAQNHALTELVAALTGQSSPQPSEIPLASKLIATRGERSQG